MSQLKTLDAFTSLWPIKRNLEARVIESTERYYRKVDTEYASASGQRTELQLISNQAEACPGAVPGNPWKDRDGKTLKDYDYYVQVHIRREQNATVYLLDYMDSVPPGETSNALGKLADLHLRLALFREHVAASWAGSDRYEYLLQLIIYINNILNEVWSDFWNTWYSKPTEMSLDFRSRTLEGFLALDVRVGHYLPALARANAHGVSLEPPLSDEERGRFLSWAGIFQWPTHWETHHPVSMRNGKPWWNKPYNPKECRVLQEDLAVVPVLSHIEVARMKTTFSQHYTAVQKATTSLRKFKAKGAAITKTKAKPKPKAKKAVTGSARKQQNNGLDSTPPASRYSQRLRDGSRGPPSDRSRDSSSTPSSHARPLTPPSSTLGREEHIEPGEEMDVDPTPSRGPTEPERSSTPRANTPRSRSTPTPSTVGERRDLNIEHDDGIFASRQPEQSEAPNANTDSALPRVAYPRQSLSYVTASPPSSSSKACVVPSSPSTRESLARSTPSEAARDVFEDLASMLVSP
ncbi:unnamed protein product [Somion occarium]|uniref:Uncharacterized protein n=1 Tax=Somion occarium TaxID=3059160 RepID=A0ABP1DYZ9_9APHY